MKKLLHLKEIEKNINQIENRLEFIKKEIAKLTREGTTCATLHARKDKDKNGNKRYFLLYPTNQGKRKKVYIGSNKDKVQEAREKIERYKRRSELVETSERIEHKISIIYDAIEKISIFAQDGILMSSFIALDEIGAYYRY